MLSPKTHVTNLENNRCNFKTSQKEIVQLLLTLLKILRTHTNQLLKLMRHHHTISKSINSSLTYDFSGILCDGIFPFQSLELITGLAVSHTKISGFVHVSNVGVKETHEIVINISILLFLETIVHFQVQSRITVSTGNRSGLEKVPFRILIIG